VEAKSKKLVGSGIGRVEIEAYEQGKLDVSLPIADCHLWTPEDPFLYQLQGSTENDQLNVTFGMRTFHFDPVTKKPKLNGEIYMMRGTNITMFRFFEDPERGFLPWDKEWVRKIIKLFKFINMNCARYCIGFPPEIWYEVADEEGFLVQDEYPIWGWEEQATVECVTQEAINWMSERNNHPSVFLWDIQNETTDERTSEVIKNVRHLDIQNRPWDNGWSSKLSPTDTDELHPYMFCDNPYWKVEQLKDLGLNDPYKHPGYPVTLNEYGWNWMTREGTPTTLSESLYNIQLPDATAEERRRFNAEIVAMKTEFWRAYRHAIIQHFCGLGYSREGGQTSDNLLPGLSHPRLEPNFEKYMRNAFAPVGLMIYHYDSIEEAGQEVTVPVYVMNDKSKAWSGEVALKIVHNSTVLAETSHYFSEVPTGYRESYEFHIAILVSGNYDLIAEYTENGETVQSIRRFTSMTREELDQKFGYGYKRNAYASSAANLYPWESTIKVLNMEPKNVNDGDYTLTRWASNHTDAEWIEIDLGCIREISKVKLVWHESEYAKEYKIQIANIPGIYTDLIHQLEGQGDIEEFRVMGSGRYVRMQGIKRASDQGYSLWEFQVFGENKQD
jgi:beta-galactosidase